MPNTSVLSVSDPSLTRNIGGQSVHAGEVIGKPSIFLSLLLFFRWIDF